MTLSLSRRAWMQFAAGVALAAGHEFRVGAAVDRAVERRGEACHADIGVGEVLLADQHEGPLRHLPAPHPGLGRGDLLEAATEVDRPRLR